MDLYILGAGASRGSLSGTMRVPTSAEFGEVLSEQWPTWRNDLPALKEVVKHLRLCELKWPLEPVWSCLDWYAKLQPALPLPKPWDDESRQLKKALLRVFGRRCDQLADNISENSTLARILQREIHGDDTLVSFNYDTLAERLARRFGTQLDARPRGGSGVAFAKPHGSVSWSLDIKVKDFVNWRSDDGAPLTESLTEEDVDAGREPLILGAVPVKSELISEVQLVCGWPSIYGIITCQWRVLVEALRDARRVVLVGYSFPPEDVYGRFLIQEGLRLRGNTLSVHYYERDCRKKKIEEEIREVFGNMAERVEYRGAVLEHST